MITEQYEQIEAFSNAHAEQAVLGALMSSEVAFDACEHLTAADFANESNKVVAGVVFGLARAGKPFDVIAVFEALQGSKTLEAIGGMVYLNGLAMYGVTQISIIKSHAALVLSNSAKRAVQSIVSASTAAMHNAPVRDVVDEMIEALDAATSSRENEKDPVDLCDSLNDLVDNLQNKKFGVNENLLPIGIKCLDSFFNGGFERQNLVVIAGRPSMGKTALAMNIGTSMSKNVRVGVFSMEMSTRDLNRRIVASLGSVPMHWMNSTTDGENDNAWDSVTVGMEEASTRSMWIDDRGALSLGQIRKTCKRAHRKGGLDVIVIDYLTQMKINTSNGSNRAQAIGDITVGLKALAKELNICVILLHQLNRGVTERQGKRPMMSDLRDSGAVEQDADIIALIHRPEYYSIEDTNAHTGETDVIVDKYRNGQRGVVKMTFKGEFSRFDDWDGTTAAVNDEYQGKKKSGGF